MTSPNRGTHEVPGVGEVRVQYGNSDLITFVDSDRDPIVVDDATAWMEERSPAADGGEQPFDGSCPMCGEPYDSYTYHLRDCDP